MCSISLRFVCRFERALSHAPCRSATSICSAGVLGVRPAHMARWLPRITSLRRVWSVLRSVGMSVSVQIAQTLAAQVSGSGVGHPPTDRRRSTMSCSLFITPSLMAVRCVSKRPGTGRPDTVCTSSSRMKYVHVLRTTGFRPCKTCILRRPIPGQSQSRPNNRQAFLDC